MVGYGIPERTTLPALKSKAKVNIFKVLKEAVGKDLTQFCVPVYFNEPLSMLQKVAERFKTEHLLQEASKHADDPVMRMAIVSAFMISMYSGIENRITKPFNPTLGETFEMMGDGW